MKFYVILYLKWYRNEFTARYGELKPERALT